MKHIAGSLLAIVLATGCAVAPLAPPPKRLFKDDLFAAPSTRVSADEVFALSDERRRFLRVQIADDLIAKGSRQALFDSLYAKSQLKLDYETRVTRNAAETYAARAGNCLSLVIMTAAFAKELNLPVRYQQAVNVDTWSRAGNVQYFVGHVNVTLGPRSTETRLTEFGASRLGSDQMTIDFLPPVETRGMST